MRLRLGITPKLTLVFVCFAAMLLVGVGALAYYNGRQALEAATVSELLTRATEKEAALNSWIKNRELEISRLARSSYLLAQMLILTQAAPGSTAAQVTHDRLVQALQVETDTKLHLELFILQPDTGQIVVSTDASQEGKFREDQPFFIEAKKGLFVQNKYPSFVLQEPSIIIAAPLHSEQGQLLGILASRLNLAEINTLMQRRTGLRQTDDAFLLNPAHLLVTQPYLLSDPAVLRRGIYTPSANACLAGSSGVAFTSDYRRIPALIVYRWLAERQLCLIVKVDQAEALAPIRAFGQTLLLGGGLALAVALIVAIGLARTITRPVLALQAGVARFGRGELSLRLPETARDELGLLAREFNHMAAALAEKEAELRCYLEELEQIVEERTAALRESEALYRSLVEISPDAITVTDLEGRILFVNQQAVRLQGYQNAAELMGLIVFDLVAPEDHIRALESAQQTLALGSLGNIEYNLLKKDRARFPVEVSASTIKNAAGQPKAFIAVVRDISRRKQMEAALRQKTEILQSILASMGDGVVVADEKGAFVLFNPAAEQILGLGPINVSPTEWPAQYGLFLADMTTPYPPEQLPLVQALQGKAINQVEIFVRHTGQPEGVLISVTGRPLIDVDGMLRGGVAVFQDITKRKQMEAALRQSEERFRASVESLLDGFAVLSAQRDQTGQIIDFQYQYINQAGCRINRKSLELHLGHTLLEVLPWQKGEGLFDAYVAVVETGEPFFRELLRYEDGAWPQPRLARAFDIRVMKLGDGIVVTWRNITERKLVEEALRESEKRFTTLFQASPAGLFISRLADGVLIDANDSFLNLLGYDWAEIMGRNTAELGFLGLETGAQIKRRWQTQESTLNLESSLPAKSGQRRQVLMGLDIVELETEPCILAAVYDITERKQTEEKLQQLNQELQRSNAELEQFAYVASHDLQEPLRMVSSYCQLLERRYKGQLDDKADKYIGFAVDGAKRMQHLVNDLLDFSRVSRKGQSFTPTDCQAVLAQARANLATAIRESGVQLEYSPLPTVLADEAQLVRLFQNLLGNAIKFRSEAPPRVCISAERANGVWRFAVADNGIGLDPEYYDRIFVIFQRLHNQEEYSGTGIGLAICKKIVERHGGQIWVESRPGQGATFYFTLPAEPA